MTSTTAATIVRMIETPCTSEFADRLDLDAGDIAYIATAGVDSGYPGTCYMVTATTDGAEWTGAAFVDDRFVAYEAGGDPVWYANTGEDDETALALALNDELPEA